MTDEAISKTLSIDWRPTHVLDRKITGDWELDTLLGKAGTGGIVTAVGRKSRFLIGAHIKDKTSAMVGSTLIRIFQGVERLSFTVDNGKEFARHKDILESLGIPVYFDHPHSPWGRGTNENTNGLIRQYFPKGLDFRKESEDDVALVIYRLNNRPRKCLNS